MFIKMKYYGLLLPANVSVNLMNYDILWLFSNLGLGSSFIIFMLFFFYCIGICSERLTLNLDLQFIKYISTLIHLLFICIFICTHFSTPEFKNWRTLPEKHVLFSTCASFSKRKKNYISLKTLYLLNSRPVWLQQGYYLRHEGIDRIWQIFHFYNKQHFS